MTHAILTCSEHFTELALNELRRHHKQLTCIQQLSPQHLHISNPGTFGHLTRPWKQKLPIYLHHLFPVHEIISLNGTSDDFVRLRQQAHALCDDDFVVQAQVVGPYRYSETAVTQSIRPGRAPTAGEPPQGRVLSVLIDGTCAYTGISWASQNLSPFAGGKREFDEPFPNRAGRKLLEALATFEIRLEAGSHALDLGAAPGAWTEILRRRGVRVTAVAPREMYDWLQVDPDVRAFHTTAEAYLTQCDTTYDLLVNDMKLDAQDSAKLMVAYAQHLRPGGVAIMTLKLRMHCPRRVMDHAFRILRKAYRIIYVRQLVSNRKEVTLFLRRDD